MKVATIVFVTAIVFAACESNSKKMSPEIKADLDVELPTEDEKTVEELNKKNRLFPYPQILSESLNNLELIHKAWESKFILCMSDRIVLFIKPIDTSRFVVISRGDESMIYYLTDANTNGQVNYEIPIESAHWYTDKQTNFLMFEKKMHFYLENDSAEYVYDLKGQISESEKRRLNWNLIAKGDWQTSQDEISHNGKYKATFNGGVDLVIENLITNEKQDFIKQEYTGNWSFGTGCWNEDDTKFYFDNSGPVACIWELDIVNRTLDKIVPEHRASKPNYMTGSEKPTIIYAEKGCVKIVVQKKLTSII